MRYALFLAPLLLIACLLAFRHPTLAEPAPGSLTTPLPTVSNEVEVLQLCSEREDLFGAIISSRAGYAHEEICRQLGRCGKVIYKQELMRSRDETRQLIYAMYGRLCDAPHKWVKDPDAVEGHVRSRFREGQPGYFVIFQAESRDHAIAWKRYIRQATGVGTTGLHVTDTPNETRRLAEFLLADQP